MSLILDFVFFAFLAGCSAPAVKLKCQELRARLEKENLGEDQRRFAEEELRVCEQDLKNAEKQDSTSLQKLHQSFTPDEGL